MKQLLIRITAVTAFFAALPVLHAQQEDIDELKKLISTLRSEVNSYRTEVETLREELDQKAPIRAATDRIKARVNGTPETIPAPKVNAKYDLRLYGYIKLDAFYDSATTSHQEIPLWTRTEANGGEFDMTAKQTRFGLESVVKDVNGGTLSGKLETDFYGKVTAPGDLSGNHAYQLRTRHAYIQWKNKDWGILAGKTFSPYSLEFPDTVNFAYYNMHGQLGHRRAQFRATRFVNSGDTKWEISGGIEEPLGAVHGGDIDGNGIDDATDSSLPKFFARSKVTFAGIGERPTTFGFCYFYGQEKAFGRKFDTMAGVVSASIPFTDKLSLKATYWQGENLDDAWGGIAQGINSSLNREISAQGGWVQLRFKPSSQYWVNLGYSVDDPDNADLNIGQRAKNTSYLFNAYYKIADPFLMGFEYFRIKTDYLGGEDATNDRLQGSFIYHF